MLLKNVMDVLKLKITYSSHLGKFLPTLYFLIGENLDYVKDEDKSKVKDKSTIRGLLFDDIKRRVLWFSTKMPVFSFTL